MPYGRDPYQNALLTNRPRNALRPVTVANGLQGMPNGLILPPTLPPTGTPLDASPRPAPPHMGKAALGHLRERTLHNIGQTDTRSKFSQREPGTEGIYRGREEFQMGEVDAFHGGGVFKKFTDDFMKTGTGGHVFGWGHYVSEEKGVGKYYADLYSKEHTSINAFTPETKELLKKKLHDDFGAVETFIKSAKRKGGTDLDAARRLRESARDYVESQKTVGSGIEKAKLFKDQAETAARMLEAGEIEFVKNAGAFYKVKLFKGKDPSEYTFLDWDKPVDKNRRELILDAFDDIVNAETDYHKASALDRALEYPAIAGLKGRHPRDKSYVPTGEDIYNELSDILGSKEAASKFLERAGISGIRYPVGSLSGKVVKGKKNYVIFNPKNIQIDEGPGFRRVMEGETPVKAKSAGTWTPPELKGIKAATKSGWKHYKPKYKKQIDKDDEFFVRFVDEESHAFNDLERNQSYAAVSDDFEYLTELNESVDNIYELVELPYGDIKYGLAHTGLAGHGPYRSIEEAKKIAREEINTGEVWKDFKKIAIYRGKDTGEYLPDGQIFDSGDVVAITDTALLKHPKFRQPARGATPVKEGSEIVTSFQKGLKKFEKDSLLEVDPDTAEWDRLTSLMDKEGDEIIEQYRKLYPTGTISLSNQAGDKGALIHPNTKEPGRWQITTWDKRGFFGDTSEATEAKAVKASGYRHIAKKKFDEISRTDEFYEGIKASKEVQKWQADYDKKVGR